MSINQDWRIRSRSHTCHKSGRPFTNGEVFYTALFESEDEDGRFERRDLAAEVWEEARAEWNPFSFWRSTYEAPVEDDGPQVVAKESAESLLRRLIDEDEAHTENARYILAVMLERKKTLRETDVRETEESLLRIYEQPKSGEVFIVKDPQLHLDEIELIQEGVLELLNGGAKPRAERPVATPDADAETQTQTQTEVHSEPAVVEAPAP
jgi:hypothetical protein